MRQVPDSRTCSRPHSNASSVRYGIIGDGRMARHFSHYLTLLGISHKNWSRKSQSDLTPFQMLEETDVVLVLISDRAIENFISENKELQSKILVHFSGSLVTPLAHGFHPMMSFATGLYNLNEYKEVVFMAEDGGPSFNAIFPELQNKTFSISSADKNMYHALCVMSGNFTTILWSKLFDELENKFHINREAAFPYLKRICENIMSDGTGALTGPIQRKDKETIQRHLFALKDDPFTDIYKAFVKMTEARGENG